VDYSENAVRLAQSLFAEHPDLSQAQFATMDFLNLDQVDRQYDLLLDKGTFDAISLMSKEGEGDHMDRIRSMVAQFKASLKKLWSSDASRFVLTSCNWTRAELESLFAPEFTVACQIDHPAFSFGGASGQVVTTLVFQLLN
jgi:EEF1A lysine methyltransferase 2